MPRSPSHLRFAYQDDDFKEEDNLEEDENDQIFDTNSQQGHGDEDQSPRGGGDELASLRSDFNLFRTDTLAFNAKLERFMNAFMVGDRVGSVPGGTSAPSGSASVRQGADPSLQIRADGVGGSVQGHEPQTNPGGHAPVPGGPTSVSDNTNRVHGNTVGGDADGTGDPFAGSEGGSRDPASVGGTKTATNAGEGLVRTRQGLEQIGSDRRRAASVLPPNTQRQTGRSGDSGKGSATRGTTPQGAFKGDRRNDSANGQRRSASPNRDTARGANKPGQSPFNISFAGYGASDGQGSSEGSKSTMDSDMFVYNAKAPERNAPVGKMLAKSSTFADFTTPEKRIPREDEDMNDEEFGDVYTPSRGRRLNVPNVYAPALRVDQEVGAVRIMQMEAYKGQPIQLADNKPLTHKVIVKAIKDVTQYRSETGSDIRFLEIMDEGSRDAVITIFTDHLQEPYSIDDLERELEGNIIAALLAHIRPHTAQAYQQILCGVVMKNPTSTMLTKYGETMHRDMMTYTLEFYNMWSVLRFSSSAYSVELQEARSMTRNSSLRSGRISSMYGAGEKRGRFEPSLNKAYANNPKSNKKREDDRNRPASLLTMFLDGMPGTLGADLYNLMGFHDGGGEDKNKNVYHMEFPDFIAVWRSCLYDLYKEVDKVTPLVRALASVGRLDRDREKQYTSYKDRNTRQSGKVNAVEFQEDSVALCDVCAIDIAKSGKADDSAVAKAGFCWSFLMGKPCREGPLCSYQHSQEAYRSLLITLQKFTPPDGVWGPSKQRRQELIKTKNMSGPMIVPRPRTTAVNEVTNPTVVKSSVDEDISTETDEEADLEHWNNQQVQAVNFESPY
jgi:hypothetical protein